MIRLRHAAASAVGILLLAAASAPAQEWPAGTVRVLLPVPPGGPMDLPSRLLVDRLAAQTKGVFILEHRAGAGGTISAQAVVQAPPDGSMLLFTTSSISAAPAFYPKLGFDPLVALTPISLITEIPIGLSVRADSPLRDLADLIAKAKAAPASTRSDRAASAPATTWPASSSRSWPGSTCCTSRFAAPRPR